MPVVLDEELLTRIKDCKSIDGLSVSAVQEALPRLMDTCLGPLFKKPSPKRPQEGRARAPVKTLFDAPPEEQLSADDQPWKTRETMDILSWCVETVDVKSAVEHQHRFYPPLLTLLGDFDVEYKMKGIPLLRKFLLNRLPPKAFSQTGLGPLVFQVISCVSCTMET